MARRLKRRETEIFSISFLDCITCAFGSVVLVYTLINAQGGLRQKTESRALQAEVSKMEEQVLEGYQRLVTLRNSLVETDQEKVRTEGMGTRVLSETERLKLELADADKETLSRREAIERLKADLKSLEEGTRRLEGAAKEASATGTRGSRRLLRSTEKESLPQTAHGTLSSWDSSEAAAFSAASATAPAARAAPR